MNKKIIIQRFFGISLFLGLLLVLLVGIGQILKPSRENWVMAKNEVYQYTKDLDYLAIGTSDVSYAVSPKYIFNETGYTGWNTSEQMQNIVMTYYSLKHLLEGTKLRPKYVFLGTENLITRANNNDKLTRKFWDNKPVNLVNFEMANNSETGYGKKGLIHSLLPIFEYHGEWKNIQPKYGADGSFGFRKVGKIHPTVTWDINKYFKDEKEKISLPERNLKYLKKILTLGREYGFKLVVVGIPNFSSYTKANFLALLRYTKTKGIDFIDLRTQQKPEYEIDYYNDFSDAWHMNENGAKKLSKLVADYLKNQGNLTDKRGDTDYAKWQ